MMLSHIFAFEWRTLRKTGSFWATLLIFPLLIGYSLYLGSERSAQQQQTIQMLSTADKAFYEEKQQQLHDIEGGASPPDVWWQNPANPLALGEFREAGKHIFVEPKPLSALAAGQLDILPYYGKVSMMEKQPLRDNALENPFMQVAGSFDVAFVLVWLLPLFIILVGYNVLSSEREQGTYKLLQSQPLSMIRLLSYKLLFRLLVLLLIVAAALLVWTSIFGISLFNAGGAMLLLMLSLYVLFWFGLCLLLNLQSGSSAVNAVSLAGAWVAFLLLIPSVISILAASLYPAPSRALWVTEQRAIEQAVQAESEQLFETWKAEHPEEIRADDAPGFYETWLQRFVMAEKRRELEREALQDFGQPARNQAMLVSRLQWLSPPMLFQSWLERQAGNDAARLRELNERMRVFQEEWNAFFFPRFRELDFFEASELHQIPEPPVLPRRGSYN